jgi:hypothetical protein
MTLDPGSPDSRIPVFINGQCIRLPQGETVAQAVALHAPDLAEKIAAGAAYVTDGRGIRIEESQAVHAGAIFRVIVSARRNQDEADAHA